MKKFKIFCIVLLISLTLVIWANMGLDSVFYILVILVGIYAVSFNGMVVCEWVDENAFRGTVIQDVTRIRVPLVGIIGGLVMLIIGWILIGIGSNILRGIILLAPIVLTVIYSKKEKRGKKK